MNGQVWSNASTMIITRVDGFTYKVMHNGVAVFTGSYPMCREYVKKYYNDL